VTRRQVIGFVVVFALVAVGLVLRSHGPGHPSSGNRLTALRAAAALDACPGGLGPQLPDLQLTCLGDGTTTRLRAAAPGRPTLVNLWATWCPPCVREVPTLVAFTRKAAGKVAVVGVDTEDEPDKALTFAQQYAMRYASFVDPDGRVLRAYGGGPPITLFVDATGAVRFQHRGELHSVAQVEALVAQHLGVRL
jgi:cytochrome c biogenesis protein CcmG/thiol:disulfide interchange protein DsbE